jgi:hypothetical protein
LVTMLCITSAVGRENDRLKLKKGIFFYRRKHN